jgi:hypothetical protein
MASWCVLGTSAIVVENLGLAYTTSDRQPKFQSPEADT